MMGQRQIHAVVRARGKAAPIDLLQEILRSLDAFQVIELTLRDDPYQAIDGLREVRLEHADFLAPEQTVGIIQDEIRGRSIERHDHAPKTDCPLRPEVGFKYK